VRFKNAFFWDVTPCGSCKNTRFGGTWWLHHQGDKNRWTNKNVNLTSNRPIFLGNVLRLLVTANAPLHSSETSVLTRAIRRQIPQDGILHSHRRENLKYYTVRLLYKCECVKGSHHLGDECVLNDIIINWMGMYGHGSISREWGLIAGSWKKRNRISRVM
jgi:hypothetical protein